MNDNREIDSVTTYINYDDGFIECRFFEIGNLRVENKIMKEQIKRAKKEINEFLDEYHKYYEDPNLDYLVDNHMEKIFDILVGDSNE